VSERKVIIDDFNNPVSNLDAPLLSIKASGAGLKLALELLDIIIICMANNDDATNQAKVIDDLKDEALLRKKPDHRQTIRSHYRADDGSALFSADVGQQQGLDDEGRDKAANSDAGSSKKGAVVECSADASELRSQRAKIFQ
jgi:hypothetical protein